MNDGRSYVILIPQVIRGLAPECGSNPMKFQTDPVLSPDTVIPVSFTLQFTDFPVLAPIWYLLLTINKDFITGDLRAVSLRFQLPS